MSYRDHLIESIEQLQTLYGEKSKGAVLKEVDRLNDGYRKLINAAPFVVVATGLHRLSKEVWPTTGSEAGILDLWVADKGALAEGAGAYPLLTEGVVDIFKGVPFGRTLRGEPITCPVLERNTIGGGMPGEYNFAIDPIAARHVFNDTEVPIWQVPADLYADCQVSMTELQAFVAPCGPIGAWLYKQALADYREPAMDAAVRAELDDFVERRKREGGAPTDF